MSSRVKQRALKLLRTALFAQADLSFSGKPAHNISDDDVLVYVQAERFLRKIAKKHKLEFKSCHFSEI